ncbi:MAG: hypothetical protein Q4A69_03090 [Moraxella sp.]|nr:hypothetical protein [Moraxella sp.]
MSQPIVLQALFTEALPFRVHNVKIDTLLCQKDLPMMFLAHYDSLPDDIKAQKPLDITLLQRMNDQMTAEQACTLLGLPQNTIQGAWHIKLIGTTVIVLDELPLAVHLQFTNTAKTTQSVYGNDPKALVEQQAAQYVFAGNVHILHKNPANQLISIDLQGNEHVICPNDGYTRLPNAHALATTQTLNTLKSRQPLALVHLEQAIFAKIRQQL